MCYDITCTILGHLHDIFSMTLFLKNLVKKLITIETSLCDMYMTDI